MKTSGIPHARTKSANFYNRPLKTNGSNGELTEQQKACSVPTISILMKTKHPVQIMVFCVVISNGVIMLPGARGILGGARGVIIIVVGHGHGDMSSNPGRD